jgi:hypothetical protein
LRGELVGARLQRDDALALQLLVLRNLLASLTKDVFLQKCLGNLEKKLVGIRWCAEARPGPSWTRHCPFGWQTCSAQSTTEWTRCSSVVRPHYNLDS